MTTRFDLISLAPTPAMRKAVFGITDDIEARAAAQATRQGANLPVPDRSFRSPGPAADSTARCLGDTGQLADALREIDFGRWRGRTLAEIEVQDPRGLAAWLADPQTAPHEGESVDDLCARTGQWLDTESRLPGRVRIVCPANVIRAAVVHCLGISTATFRRLDIQPLSLTRLSCHNGQWRLQGMSCDF